MCRLLEFLVFVPQSIDTVNHLLDQLNLRVSEPVLVGDVIGESSLATRLSTGSTGLQVQLLAASLQLVNAVLGPARQVNVDGGPHASTKVGGARVDVTEPLIKTEVLARFLLEESPTALIPLASLENTSLTSPPICMEMIPMYSA